MPRDVTALKAKGDLAEIKVAADLMRRGYKIALPYGEDWDFDLIVCRGPRRLERVQVKYAASSAGCLEVRCRSQSLTGGRVRAVKRYTAETIDWLAVFDVRTDRCFYLPAEELAGGRSTLTLRMSPARNGQRARVRLASDYERI